MWSYGSYGAQCGVTTSHSTCGSCVRDYHNSFRLFALSNPFVPTVFERSTKEGWHNSAGSSDGQVIWVARLFSNSKNRENLLLTNNKKGFVRQ